MSTEMINCALCGNQMPANARFCPECGSANARIAASDENSLVMPQPEGRPGTDTSAQQATTAKSEGGARVYDTPPAGTPTVNMSAPGPVPQYTPPMASPKPTPSPPQTSYAAYTPPPQHGQTQSINQPPSPSNITYSQAPLGGQNSLPARAGTFPRDGTVALLLELLGYVFFLGIGHMYGGRIGRGIALLIVWWAYWGIVAVLVLTFILSPLACVMAILWPVVPIISGFWIKNELDRSRTN